MTLPSPLAEAGNLLESRLAPPLYRRSRIVTLSESSRHEIVALPGIRKNRVTVVPPGIDRRVLARWSTLGSTARGGRRSARARQELPEADRDPGASPREDSRSRGGHRRRGNRSDPASRRGCGSWARTATSTFPAGSVSDELVDLYRRAWVVASTSIREGWGMTVSEAAACETPAVATRIPGHVDAIDHGLTGMLADRDEDFEQGARAVASRSNAPAPPWPGGGRPCCLAHLGGDGQRDSGCAAARPVAVGQAPLIQAVAPRRSGLSGSPAVAVRADELDRSIGQRARPRPRTPGRRRSRSCGATASPGG